MKDPLGLHGTLFNSAVQCSAVFNVKIVLKYILFVLLVSYFQCEEYDLQCMQHPAATHPRAAKNREWRTIVR